MFCSFLVKLEPSCAEPVVGVVDETLAISVGLFGVVLFGLSLLLLPMTMVTRLGEFLDVKPSLVPTTVLRKLVVGLGRGKLVNFKPLLLLIFAVNAMDTIINLNQISLWKIIIRNSFKIPPELSRTFIGFCLTKPRLLERTLL